MSLKRRLSVDDPCFSPQTKCCEEPNSLRKRLRVAGFNAPDQSCQALLGINVPQTHDCGGLPNPTSPPPHQLYPGLSPQAAALTPSKDDALLEAVFNGGQHLSLSEMNNLLKQLHFERLQRLAAAPDGSQGT